MIRVSISFRTHVLLLFLTAVMMRWVVLDCYHVDMSIIETGNPYVRARSAFFYGDSEHYFSEAHTLSETGIFGLPFRPLFYVAVLAASFLLLHPGYFIAHCVQILLGSLLPVVFALLARKWLSDRAGIMTGWLTALSFQMIVLSATLCSEILFILLIGISLLLGESRRRSCHVLTGVLLGLSVLTRSEGAVFIALIVLLQLFPRTHSLLRRLMIPSVILATVMAWSIRNYLVMDTAFPHGSWRNKIIPISSNGPMNFYLGNGPTANGGYRTLDKADNIDKKSDRLNFEDPLHNAVFYHGLQLGIDHLSLYPEQIPDLLRNKLRYYTRGLRTGFGTCDLPWGLRGNLRRGDIWTPETAFPVWLLLLGSIAGWIVTARQRPKPVALIIGFVLAGYLNALVFFGLARNAAMSLPFLFMSVSMLIDWMVNQCQQVNDSGGANVSTAPSTPSGNRWACLRMIVGTAEFLMIAALIADTAWLAYHPVTVPSFRSIISGRWPAADIRSNDERNRVLSDYRMILNRVDNAPMIIILDENVSLFLTHYAFLIHGDDPVKMRDFISRALQMDCSNAEAWKVRGLLAMKESKFVEANAAFRRYIQLEPGAADIANIKTLIERNRKEK